MHRYHTGATTASPNLSQGPKIAKDDIHLFFTELLASLALSSGNHFALPLKVTVLCKKQQGSMGLECLIEGCNLIIPSPAQRQRARSSTEVYTSLRHPFEHELQVTANVATRAALKLDRPDAVSQMRTGFQSCKASR